MFGSSKSSDLLENRHSGQLTGLERAKLERSQQGEMPQSVSPQLLAPESVLAPDPVLAPEPVIAPLPAAPTSRSAAVELKPIQPASSAPLPAAESTAHVHAGPGVKLKGDITGCDTLRVEGVVDGNATARQLTVCAGGVFLGTAEVDEAEIEGNFDGTLNVHGRLLLRSNGRVAGTLSYGQMEVERGGEIAGQITPVGKQIAAKPHSGTAFVSVPNERRALSSAPKPLPQSVVQMPRPAARVEETAAHAPTPAQPNPPMRLEQTPAPTRPNPPMRLERPAVAKPPPASEPPARKSLFFGRH